jgi:para-aminobenzoate synthetase component 1
MELPWLEPERVFLAVADDPYTVFLDSAAPGDKRSKISYICLNPFDVLELKPDEDDPFAMVESWLESARPCHQRPAAWPFPFAGGAVGWLGYDAGRAAMGLASRFAPMPGLPGGWFGLYETIIGFDLAAQRAFLLAPETELAALAARLRVANVFPPPPARPAWQPELTRAEYEARIERLREYISAGDIYQANFTMRFTAPRPEDFVPAAYYAALRQRSPAPFAAYIGCGDGVAICGASPERFLRLTADGRVETRPIKGTASRHADAAADAASIAALLASPKERAENLMITDLLRNDLGQVCETGSITVPELFAIESFAQVHHLVSAVTGRLRSGLGAVDLLRACFPGGSITGAPKRRAMEIIDELEEGPRGAYCGTLAWIGFDGAMDSAIIIRSLLATGETLFAQAGGGITWDSNPAAEYDEMMLKVANLLAVGHG